MILPKVEDAVVAWLRHNLPSDQLAIVSARSGGAPLQPPHCVVAASDLSAHEGFPSSAGVFDLTVTLTITWPAAGTEANQRPPELDAILDAIDCAIIDGSLATTANDDTADWFPLTIYEQFATSSTPDTLESSYLETITLALTANEA